MNKLLKTVALLCAIVLCTALCACSAPVDEPFEIDTTNMSFGTYEYKVTTAGQDLVVERYTSYTVSATEYEGKRVYLVNSKATHNTEFMYKNSYILADAQDGYTALTPCFYELSYGDTENHKDDVDASATHNLVNGTITINVEQYPQNGGTDKETMNVTVATGKQYYDSESLMFIIPTLPLSVGYSRNFSMSSVNRDGLTSMNLQCTEELDITVAGEKHRCYCVLVRPNTMFTNDGTYMYFDTATKLPVMLKTANEKIELLSFTPAIVEPAD